MGERQAKTYRILTISVYPNEAAEADRLTEQLRDGGWSNANRSLVLREGLMRLREELAGKSSDEVVRDFTERQAKRAKARAVAAGTSLEVTPEPAHVDSPLTDLDVLVTIGPSDK